MIEQELINELLKDDRYMKDIAAEAGIATSTVSGFRAKRHHVSLYVAEQIARTLGKKLVLVDDNG